VMGFLDVPKGGKSKPLDARPTEKIGTDEESPK
jgi:hypothetical protein